MDKVIKNLAYDIIGSQETRVGELIRNVPERDRLEFEKMTDLYKKMLDCMENPKANEFCSAVILNTVTPSHYDDMYFYEAMRTIVEHSTVKKGHEEELKKIMEEMTTDENMDMFKYFLEYGLQTIEDISGQYMKDSIGELDDKAKAIIERDKSMVSDFPLVSTMQNVKLYHGTSYDNYLKIKKDGFIKPSDYSDGNYKGHENIKEIYLNENGYVFVIDSMDFPLRTCLGGERKNLIQSWAYDDELDKDTRNHDLGVIFEIDPTNYEVYFNRLKREFMIKGKVSMADVRPIFYRFTDRYEFVEITEIEMKKLWKKGRR